MKSEITTMSLQIITLTCPKCGTITAGNLLEEQREMKCAGLDCEAVLRFTDLDLEDREYMLSNRSVYTMEDQ
jgi:hypothetical protein